MAVWRLGSRDQGSWIFDCSVVVLARGPLIWRHDQRTTIHDLVTAGERLNDCTHVTEIVFDLLPGGRGAPHHADGKQTLAESGGVACRAVRQMLEDGFQQSLAHQLQHGERQHEVRAAEHLVPDLPRLHDAQACCRPLSLARSAVGCRFWPDFGLRCSVFGARRSTHWTEHALDGLMATVVVWAILLGIRRSMK